MNMTRAWAIVPAAAALLAVSLHGQQTPPRGPGGESRFVVSVPSAADVGRYRVSFRTDDRVVPHVDRREPALARR